MAFLNSSILNTLKLVLSVILVILSTNFSHDFKTMYQRKFQTSDMKNNYDIGSYLYSGFLKPTLIAVEAETGLEREKETWDLHESLENIFRLRLSVSLIFAIHRTKPLQHVNCLLGGMADESDSGG